VPRRGRARVLMNRHSALSLLMVVTEDWYFLSHRLALAAAARRHGIVVTIATGPGERSPEIRKAGFEHLTFPLERRSLRPSRELATLRSLTTLMRRRRFGLIHLVAAKPILYGNIAAALAGRPPVLSAVAGLGYLYLGGGAGRLMLRTAYESTFRTLVRPRKNARVLVQNPDDSELLQRRKMARPEQIVRVTGSGVDVERFFPSPEPEGSPIVVLMHSRMLWDKGVGELVEAARLLRQRSIPNFVVRLVGEPDPQNPASIEREQLRRWSEGGEIEWVGRRDDIPSELRRCHVACLPSYREGAPLSLLEAAAAGRPIVTTDVPGCREVVHHEKNGLLVPARNAGALAAALDRVIRDPILRRTLGHCGRERAEREFSSGVVNDRIVATYFDMIEASRHE
jgi:glycosyltransferase involved in cell wall biosynthesis